MKTREAVNMQEVGSISEMYINATADRYGSNSMELAEVLLELAWEIIWRPTTAPGKDRDAESLVTHDGYHFAGTLLNAYLFQKPESIESRLLQVERVLLSALSRWSVTAEVKFGYAATALLDSATYYLAIRKFDYFEDLIMTVLGLARAYSGPGNLMLSAETLRLLGEVYQRHSKLEESEAVLGEAFALCTCDDAIMAISGPGILLTSAMTAVASQKLDSATRHLQRAMKILAKQVVVDRGAVLKLLCLQARVCLLTQNRHGFERTARKAQQVAREIWEIQPELVVEFMVELAALYSSAGAKPEAEKIMEKLIQDIEILGFSEDTLTTADGLMRQLRRIMKGANSYQSEGDLAS